MMYGHHRSHYAGCNSLYYILLIFITKSSQSDASNDGGTSLTRISVLPRLESAHPENHYHTIPLRHKNEIFNQSHLFVTENTLQIVQSRDIEINVNKSLREFLQPDENISILNKANSINRPKNVNSHPNLSKRKNKLKRNTSLNEKYSKKLRHQSANENSDGLHDKKNDRIRHSRKKEGHREIIGQRFGTNNKQNSFNRLSRERINNANKKAPVTDYKKGNYPKWQNSINRKEEYGHIRSEEKIVSYRKDEDWKPVDKQNSERNKIATDDGDIIGMRDMKPKGVNNYSKVERITHLAEENPNLTGERKKKKENFYFEGKEETYLSTTAEEALLLAIPLSLLLTLFILTFAACCCFRQSGQVPVTWQQENLRYQLAADFDEDEEFEGDKRPPGTGCCGCRALESCCLPDLSYQIHRAEWVKRYTLSDDDRNYDVLEDELAHYEDEEPYDIKGHPPLYALLSNLPPQRRKKTEYDHRLRKSKSVEFLYA